MSDMGQKDLRNVVAMSVKFMEWIFSIFSSLSQSISLGDLPKSGDNENSETSAVRTFFKCSHVPAIIVRTTTLGNLDTQTSKQVSKNIVWTLEGSCKARSSVSVYRVHINALKSNRGHPNTKIPERASGNPVRCPESS